MACGQCHHTVFNYQLLIIMIRYNRIYMGSHLRVILVGEYTTLWWDKILLTTLIFLDLDLEHMSKWNKYKNLQILSVSVYPAISNFHILIVLLAEHIHHFIDPAFAAGINNMPKKSNHVIFSGRNTTYNLYSIWGSPMTTLVSDEERW